MIITTSRDKTILTPIEKSQKTESGIYLPLNVKEDHGKGTVFFSDTIPEGSTALYKKGKEHVYNIGGTTYIILNNKDIDLYYTDK